MQEPVTVVEHLRARALSSALRRGSSVSPPIPPLHTRIARVLYFVGPAGQYLLRSTAVTSRREVWRVLKVLFLHWKTIIGQVHLPEGAACTGQHAVLAQGQETGNTPPDLGRNGQPVSPSSHPAEEHTIG